MYLYDSSASKGCFTDPFLYLFLKFLPMPLILVCIYSNICSLIEGFFVYSYLAMICACWWFYVCLIFIFTIVLLQYRITCKTLKVVSAHICIEIPKQYSYSDDCLPFCHFYGWSLWMVFCDLKNRYTLQLLKWLFTIPSFYSDFKILQKGPCLINKQGLEEVLRS